VIDSGGETLLNTLVRPTISISQEAMAVHGINEEMVSSAPGFPEIYPQLKTVLMGKQIAIYNDGFDRRVLNYCCRLHQLPLLGFKDRTVCLMHWYSRWYGEYSSYWRDYKYQPLGGSHRALGDCLQALKLLKEMADDDPVFRVPDFLEEK
jgi:DNA polymerase III subunit epsilon